MKILCHHRTASRDGQAVHIEEMVAYASPLKLPEYLMMGKAIAPRTPDLLEVLTDGENALMFDEAAANGLERALTRLGADEALRERRARGAWENIGRFDLTWQGNARRVGERFRSLMPVSPR